MRTIAKDAGKIWVIYGYMIMIQIIKTIDQKDNTEKDIFVF